MKRMLSWGIGAVLAAVAWGEPAQPFRRALSPAAKAGWTQVQLDAEAQAWAETAWIGDATGQPIPFLRESEMRSHDLPVQVRGLVTGTDDSGRPTAEFRVEGNAGESLVRRETWRSLGSGALGVRSDTRHAMNLTLDVDAKSPWVAEVEVALQPHGGEWTTLTDRVQVYDFGGEFRRLEFPVPRQSSVWRLRLRTIQGEIRGLRAVRATVAGIAAPLDVRRSALGVSREDEDWVLTLPAGAQRALAVHLNLQGVVAPVRAEVWRIERRDGDRGEAATWAGAAQVWNMPGLDSREGEVRFGTPVVGERFRVKLPAGVAIASAEAEVAGESFWFVAEKGGAYFLHLGGEKRPAPGNLAALPSALDAPLPELLTIGPPADDPFGKPRREDVSEIAKRWLPWAVGAAVAVLAGLALRMSQRKPDGAA